MKRIVFLLICLVLAPQSVGQETGHIILLAVSDATSLGSVADLYLTTNDGTGGVYIETSPLTRLDTQLSTRFAQQIGCDFVDKDCTTTDFFYTVRSDATIIGGPSAGAAIAALTVAMVDDLEIDETVTVTGTINVGGLIGPVSGLIGKIDAAKDVGMTKVLIPKGSRYQEEPSHHYNENLDDYTASYYRYNNETKIYEIDAFAYGEFVGVKVVEVATLQEAVYEITGILYEADETEITPEDWYSATMEKVTNDLCTRYRKLGYEIEAINETSEESEEIINTTIHAENATAYDMFYVAASTCFGGNIRLQYLLFESSTIDINTAAQQLNISISALQNEIDAKELKTMTDLQTYLVVNERLEEARQTTAEIMILYAMNSSTNLSYQFAYATERLYSAKTWSLFFDKNGKELQLDDDALELSCTRKLGEAQDRYQYVKLITAEPLEKIVNYIDLAYIAYENEDYLVCLDMASRAKANLDIILSLIGVQDEEEIAALVEERLRLVRQVLHRQQDAGYFPILGYSYYEYAGFLQEKDPYSALIYSHYALEFSHLDMYFEEKEPQWMLVVDQENALYFLFGFCLGILTCCIATIISRRKKMLK